MAASPSKFVWYDLMTPDMQAAESFYRRVIGWDARDAGMPHTRYTLLSAGPSMVAGLMEITPEAREHGARPSWLGHIGVDDVDAYAERVARAGGAIHKAHLPSTQNCSAGPMPATWIWGLPGSTG